MYKTLTVFQEKIALVAGSTGLVGSALALKLDKYTDYSKVILLSRSGKAFINGKTENKVIDYDDLERSLSDINPDHVFCTLGTTISKAGSQKAFRYVDHDLVFALGKWALKKRVSYFGVVTSMGANAGSSFFYNKVKGEIETSLSNLDLRRLGIFRPSLLLGKRKVSRFGENVGKLIFSLSSFLFIGPLENYKGISADRVADAMIKDSFKIVEGKRIISNKEML